MRWTTTSTIFCFFIFLNFNAFGQTIDRGPYLQTVTPQSIIIKWRTTSATSSKVWYGNDPSNLNLTLSVGANVTDHEMQISDLSQNTKYYYAVGNANGQMAGGDPNHYFITSPDNSGNQTVRIWALGDCGTGNSNQRAVRDAYYDFIGADHTDVILLLGDNAYSDGTQSEYQNALFENMYEDKLINSVLWPSFGNHDGHSSLSVTQTGPYYDIFSVPKNGEAGGEPSGTEAYYSFDYGNIHFICLNSDDIDADPEEDMMQWLVSDLESTNQDWIIVFFHHSPYTGEEGNDSDHSSSATDMREIAAPIMEAGGVDLVLAGHTHAYERSYLINGHYNDSPTFDPNTMIIDGGDGRVDGDGAYFKENSSNGIGTVYVVAGSSGKLDQDDYNYPAMIHSFEKLGSFAIEVEGLQLNANFIDSEGIIQDYFTIVKMHDPPVVNITQPTDQQYYPTPQVVTITADASDVNGTVTQVEFFVNNTSIGVDNGAPYSINWLIPSEGTFNIKAIATDNDGFFSSSSISINVGHLESCVRVNASSDDAEEKPDGSVSLTSSDLELVNDGGNQTIGMRFKNHEIPQCAEIQSAYIQFTVEGTDNLNPCNLNIFAEASDDPVTFSDNDWNITSRERTVASATWSPPDWLNIGDSGVGQQTVDISPLIQEVVNRPGFTANSSIVIIIDGVGERGAESFDGNALSAPQICISYYPDGADEDGDGVCDALDQCPGSPEPGMPCDDGDPETTNDTVTDDCDCVGSTTYDCPELMANYGDPCDDGDDISINDMIDVSCNCVGQFFMEQSITAGSDDAEESENGAVNLTSSDLEMVVDDDDIQTIGLRFNHILIQQGAVIDSAYIQFTVEEPENIDPCELLISGQAVDNAVTFSSADFNISNRPLTTSTVSWLPDAWTIDDESGTAQRTSDISAVIQEIINRDGFVSGNSIAIIIEGEGMRTAFSYDGDPQKAAKIKIYFRGQTIGVKPDLQGGKSNVSVFPVPATDHLNVTFNCVAAQEIPLWISDLNGRNYYSGTHKVAAGKNKLLLENLDLPDGMYFLQLSVDGGWLVAKFIILE